MGQIIVWIIQVIVCGIVVAISYALLRSRSNPIHALGWIVIGFGTYRAIAVSVESIRTFDLGGDWSGIMAIILNVFFLLGLGAAVYAGFVDRHKAVVVSEDKDFRYKGPLKEPDEPA